MKGFVYEIQMEDLISSNHSHIPSLLLMQCICALNEPAASCTVCGTRHPVKSRLRNDDFC